MGIQLNDYYKKFSTLNYWYSFLDVCDEFRGYQDLNKCISSDLQEDFYAYVLWDKLFYNNEDFLFDEDLFFGDITKKTQRIDNIHKVLKNQKAREYLDIIASRWPAFRDHFYSQDKSKLDKCKTIKDYDDFINTNPDTYGEYIFIAEYKKSRIAKKPFRHLSELKRRFPKSELLSQISDRIQIVNGIQYMFSEEIEENETIQKLLIDFINNFELISLQGTNDRISCFMCQRIPISNELWYAVIDLFNLDIGKSPLKFRNRKELCKFAVATYYEFEQVMQKLSELLSVNFVLPTSDQMLTIIKKQNSVKLDKEGQWEWIRAPDGKNGNVVYTTNYSAINKDMMTVYNVPKQFYAAGRLIIEK